MKQELNDLLKESLEEEEEVATDDEETPIEEQPISDEEGDDMSDEDAEADDAEVDDAENDTDLDNEPSKGIDSLDSGDDESEEGLDDEESFGDFGSGDMDTEGEDADDVMDMTGASDEEVLKVFKAMKPEDGIVVKKDGNNLEFGTGEDDYIIKLDNEDMEEEMSPMAEEDAEMADDEEAIYEIEMDEEEMEDAEEEMAEEEEEDTKEIEATEAARTFANDVRKPADQGKKFKAGRHEMNEEVENLKKQNAEYKKALVLFKEKLNEVAVFNANLAYATRLFTEHSTTKQEKLNILKRFDTVSTMNEAKSLFNTIKTELGGKTTVTESVVNKISNAPSTSSSQEVLAEAKAYENPQFKRMKDLMSKIK
jgi:hypothetical protein